MFVGCGVNRNVSVNGEIAFVNVSVLTMEDERVLEHQTVVVDNGRIALIGRTDEVTLAEDVEVIEAAGQYLMPGLTEMHGHLPNPQMSDTDVQNILFLYLAKGVTTVRGMQGHPSQFDIRDQITRGVLLGPNLYLASVAITGRRVSTPELAEQLVREYKVQGYDLVKVLEGLSRETYDTVARTAIEVGIPFAGHVPDRVGLLHALSSGQISIDHLDNYIEALVPDADQPEEWPGIGRESVILESVDESLIPDIVDATLDAGAWVVPTMVLWETGILSTRPAMAVLSDRPEVQYVHPEMVNRWIQGVESNLSNGDVQTNQRLAALRRTVLRALYKGGVNIALGTDSPQTFSVPGFSVHREMQLYADIGMTPYDILEIGTRKPAEYFGATREFGMVAVGRRADLILLTANPLEDIANAEEQAGVMVGGRWLSNKEIRQRLEAIAIHYG